MDHPVSSRCLERFAEGRTTPAENRSLVAHLMRGCADCSRRLAKLVRPEIPAGAYDAVFTRVERSVSDTIGGLQHEPVLVEAR
jgi:hypothetical protein